MGCVLASLSYVVSISSTETSFSYWIEFILEFIFGRDSCLLSNTEIFFFIFSFSGRNIDRILIISLLIMERVTGNFYKSFTDHLCLMFIHLSTSIFIQNLFPCMILLKFIKQLFRFIIT